jgi:dethiobiotin synthetase
MSHRLFITACGTGLGKTLLGSLILRQARQAGYSARPLKPIVSGFSFEDPASDPVLLLEASGQVPSSTAIESIAPWRFDAPLSPDMAAELAGRTVPFDAVVAFCRAAPVPHVHLVVIEGAGGVMTPIDHEHTMLDLIKAIEAHAVLVSGTYLGALSHSLTAWNALANAGILLRGLVVSESEDSVGLDRTLATLKRFVDQSIPIIALPRLMAQGREPLEQVPNLLHLLAPGLCAEQGGGRK